MINDPRTLIGRKVELKHTQSTITTLMGVHELDSYEVVDTDFLAEVKAAWPSCRVFPPGSGGTCDYVEGRVNINIDVNGIVESIDIG